MPAGEGVLRLCGQLSLAPEDDGWRAIGDRAAARTRPGIHRSFARRPGQSQPAPTELQAHQRLHCMGPGFPADCFAENQAHHPGRRNWAAPGARKRRGRAVRERFLAVVNPAAGGGRCGRLAPTAIEKLRAAGVPLEVIESRGPGQATQLVREAYARGYRKLLAVGGDGTAYEIVNGLFPGAADGERAALGFLPLGTGNSSCATSPIAVWSTRPRLSSEGEGAPATCCGSHTKTGFFTTSTC